MPVSKNRQIDIRSFVESLDLVVFIAGQEFVERKLLFETARSVNRNTLLRRSARRADPRIV